LIWLKASGVLADTGRWLLDKGFAHHNSERPAMQP